MRRDEEFDPGSQGIAKLHPEIEALFEKAFSIWKSGSNFVELLNMHRSALLKGFVSPNQEERLEQLARGVEVPQGRLIKVWTDGATFPNPGQGGWAWTTLKGQQGSGGRKHTTNQMMELLAVIEAIGTLASEGVTLLVISDSQYVIKGATDWKNKWIKNGWRNANGQAVKNRPLWEELVNLLNANPVSFQWVKGHSGDPGNEEADRLATEASKADSDLIQACRSRWEGGARE